ncbi:MAG: hypothetical protein K6G90_05750 [Clostridia bacterium]|nr:hypothetical protein [Clostridia bacterium]
MNTDYEKVFHLKQHSPLIHFQSEQTGATLRATEVKPKLDRFILKKLGGAEKVRQEHKNWFLGDKDALNYKLRFSSPDFERLDLGPRTDYEIYFGNMGKNTRPVKAVRFLSDVAMTVICFDNELMETIGSLISGFFLVTNFGRMQSKGFGSFCAGGDPDENTVAAALKKEYQAKVCYAFESDKPFKDIKTIYSIMKSGVNFHGYRRSLLFLYMHKLGIGNEKAKLKQQGIAPVVSNGHGHQHDLNNNNEESRYVRSLLGVGDHIEFLNDLSNRRDKTTISISNPEIERYQSTVFFKIVGRTVYFVGKRIDSGIFGKTFTFKKGGSSVKIPVPEKSEQIDENFMDGFLAYAVTELNKTRNELDPGSGTTALSSFLERQIKIRRIQ